MPITIDKPSKYFNTVTYSGTGSNQAITVGFKPDFVWTKRRNAAYSNELQDAVRGTTKVNYSDNTNAEDTTSTNIQTFDTNGYTQGTGTGVNGSDGTYVSWNWLGANTTASNTSGTISSTVSANTTSGFSIVSYTGNGTGGATVGHGLGAVPKMIIIKNRDDTDSWEIYHASLGATKYMQFTTAAAATNINRWNDTAPTSSVFSLGTEAGVNQSTEKFIAYCFAEVKGFSKFGSYTGNGNADGTFVYTGFKPAFLIIKESSAAGAQWYMYDNKTATFNLVNENLFPNLANATNSGNNQVDFYSNGFKMRSSNTDTNNSGNTYIYMTFAENPFVSSTQVPTTAR
jgi:hypothetical protein